MSFLLVFNVPWIPSHRVLRFACLIFHEGLRIKAGGIFSAPSAIAPFAGRDGGERPGRIPWETSDRTTPPKMTQARGVPRDSLDVAFHQLVSRGGAKSADCSLVVSRGGEFGLFGRLVRERIGVRLLARSCAGLLRAGKNSHLSKALSRLQRMLLVTAWRSLWRC